MTDASTDTAIAQAFLKHLLAAWERCGIPHDVDVILSGAGITRQQVVQGEVYLQDYFRVVEVAAPVAVDSELFFEVGCSQSLFDLGIIGYALYSAPNLRRSWDMSLGQSKGLVPHPISITRDVSDRFAGIILHPPADMDAPVRKAFSEEWLFGTWRWTCQRLPELAVCEQARLHFSYAAPKYHRCYRKAFAGSIRFNMPETALWVPREYYEKPFESANELIMRLCHQKSLAKSVRPEGNSDLASEVRLYLLQNARSAFPNLQETAESFRMPSHTLHRRLVRQNTTFRQVKLEVRMLLAKQYLRQTNLSLQMIADLLGYGQSTSFVRAFRCWYGISPIKFRKI